MLEQQAGFFGKLVNRFPVGIGAGVLLLGRVLGFERKRQEPDRFVVVVGQHVEDGGAPEHAFRRGNLSHSGS